MKNHLKRIAAPKTWLVDRKESTFIVRPNPGSHSLAAGLPLGVILRDHLHLASVMSEIRKILHGKPVLVDGKRREDHRLMVGLFDVISIPELTKNYRVLFDQKGRLTTVEISADEASLKLCKIVGKSVIKTGKTQFHLHDGKNVLLDREARVGDTLLLKLPSLEVKDIFPFKEHSSIYLVKGKHSGDMGVLKSIKGTEIIYTSQGEEIETAKAYVFVVGGKTSALSIH